MRILVTGGCGFIGSHFVRQIVRTPETEIVVFDALTYAAADTFKDLPVTVVKGNIRDCRLIASVLRKHRISHVIHMAAETHVDRSIDDPHAFMRTNVYGTYNLVEACRAASKQIERLVYVSTDEVYGPVYEDDKALEVDTLLPSSPYSASKAAAEMICSGHFVTYGLPVVITRGTNTYGPFQNTEKLIPKVITRIMAKQPVPIYGNGMHEREWLYAADHANGIWTAMMKGLTGETYNIGSGCVMSNLEIVNRIATIIKENGGPDAVIEHVKDRRGHDARYAVDSSKIRRLGWTDSGFSLTSTVIHYMHQCNSQQEK